MSTRLALETEDVGANILQDLRRQREQIEHSRDTVCADLSLHISFMAPMHISTALRAHCNR